MSPAEPRLTMGTTETTGITADILIMVRRTIPLEIMARTDNTETTETMGTTGTMGTTELFVFVVGDFIPVVRKQLPV